MKPGPRVAMVSVMLFCFMASPRAPVPLQKHVESTRAAMLDMGLVDAADERPHIGLAEPERQLVADPTPRLGAQPSLPTAAEIDAILAQ